MRFTSNPNATYGSGIGRKRKKESLPWHTRIIRELLLDYKRKKISLKKLGEELNDLFDCFEE